MLLIWITIAALIGVNSFYVLAEFAAVSVRQTQLRPLADHGHRVAGRLLPIVSDPRRLDQYIAACQIGITLSSLVLGAYAQATLALAAVPMLESWGVGTATATAVAAITVLVTLTILQVVVGELVPKSLALQYPLRAALASYWPMHLSVLLSSRFIRVLNGTGLAFLRALRVPEASHRHIHSPEEIDLLIAESAQRGVLQADDQQRLRRALRLGLRTARELMVPRLQVVAVDADAPLTTVLRQLAETRYTRLPVYRRTLDDVVGMVHTRDLVAHYVERGGLASIHEAIQPLLSVPESLHADRLLVQMASTARRSRSSSMNSAAWRVWSPCRTCWSSSWAMSRRRSGLGSPSPSGYPRAACACPVSCGCTRPRRGWECSGAATRSPWAGASSRRSGGCRSAASER
jgi:putative hemolysin